MDEKLTGNQAGSGVQIFPASVRWSGSTRLNYQIISNDYREILGHDNNDNNDCIQRRSSRFFTISSLRRELPPTHTFKWPERNRVQITCNTSSTYHVQRVVCHLVRRDSSLIKFDRDEIAFILELFYWLKPLTDEIG